LDILKLKEIPLELTALGAPAKRMVRNLQNSKGNHDDSAIKEPEAILQVHKEKNSPNAR
jgi:hypothetical protein